MFRLVFGIFAEHLGQGCRPHAEHLDETRALLRVRRRTLVQEPGRTLNATSRLFARENWRLSAAQRPARRSATILSFVGVLPPAGPTRERIPLRCPPGTRPSHVCEVAQLTSSPVVRCAPIISPGSSNAYSALCLVALQPRSAICTSRYSGLITPKLKPSLPMDTPS